MELTGGKSLNAPASVQMEDRTAADTDGDRNTSYLLWICCSNRVVVGSGRYMEYLRESVGELINQSSAHLCSKSCLIQQVSAVSVNYSVSTFNSQ